MIKGIVSTDRDAVIRLTICGARGKTERIAAVIDTGFNGDLTLPRSVITRLGLPWRRRGRALMEDGTDSIFDIYDATVIWDRRRRSISVDEAETTPLVGMSLMDGFDLNVRVRAKGKVTLTRIIE